MVLILPPPLTMYQKRKRKHGWLLNRGILKSSDWYYLPWEVPRGGGILVLTDQYVFLLSIMLTEKFRN
jgi:hypothetical protein